MAPVRSLERDKHPSLEGSGESSAAKILHERHRWFEGYWNTYRLSLHAVFDQAVFDGAPLGRTSTAMLPGLCWFFHILAGVAGNILPSRRPTCRDRCGVRPPAWLAWLACRRLAKWLPWMRFCIQTKTRVEGDVVAGGAGAEHHHAAALHHEAGDREGGSPGCSKTKSTFMPCR